MFNSWRQISFSKKTSLVYVVLLVVSLPFGVKGAQQQQALVSQANYQLSMAPVDGDSLITPKTIPILGGCVVGGCNSELCVAAGGGPIESVCFYREEYACYRTAKCEVQVNGHCGWTGTDELRACLAGGGIVENPALPSPVPTRTPPPSPAQASPLPQPSPAAISPNDDTPVIVTQSLPEGVVGKNYAAVVTAYDDDTEANLTMIAQGLPPEVELTGCQQYQELSRAMIKCRLRGMMSQVDEYPVTVMVKDEVNLLASRNLKLTARSGPEDGQKPWWQNWFQSWWRWLFPL